MNARCPPTAALEGQLLSLPARQRAEAEVGEPSSPLPVPGSGLTAAQEGPAARRDRQTPTVIPRLL